jgi:hypothetical protein
MKISEAKEKRKAFPVRRRRWIFLLFIPVVTLLLLIILALVGAYVQEDTIKSSLDAEYVPTAEYLLQNPEHENETVWLKVFGDTSSTRVCIYYSLLLQEAENLEIYLNTERANFPISTSFGMPALNPVQTSLNQPKLGNRCTMQKLESGIHLLEVRLKYSRFEAPFHVHRWAFVIEE